MIKEKLLELKKGLKNNKFFILAAISTLIAFSVACGLSLRHYRDYSVLTSVISNINIMLITTNATMIGLYVTAFIFLNDSLKSRVKEDATINDAVRKILKSYRNKMIGMAVGTILVIVATLVLNLFIGDLSKSTDEEVKITLCDGRWIWFLACMAASVIMIIWIIISSREMTDSDELIYIHSKNNRIDNARRIQALFDDIQSQYNNGEPSNARNGSYFKNDNEIGVIGKKLLGYKEDKGCFEFKAYTFLDAYKKMAAELADSKEIAPSSYKERKARQKIKSGSITKLEQKEVDEFKKLNSELEQRENLYSECEIEFGKIVRLLENMIGRISDNNIDKSIMNTDYKIDSIANGFRWLYANTGHIEANPNESGKAQNSDNVIDVRDAKRFLDHVKYCIITHETFHTRPFNNRDVERIYERARLAFDSLTFTEKKELIAQYKKNTSAIIDRFFEGYKLIVGYRDAMVHQKHYNEKKKIVIVDPEIKKVLSYAKLLKRVLLDRFMSFVRTDDLSLGNSNMDKGWFNFSELSKSNFTHSSFKYACLENAIFRDCDLSTCSFVMADASGTDFSKSNFNYSDLTGMDLKDSNLNEAQLNSVVLRDARIDSYGGFSKFQFFKDENGERETKRCKWRDELKGKGDTETGEDGNEKYEKICKELRSGKNLNNIIQDVKNEAISAKSEKSVSVLLYDDNGQVCGTVLDELHQALNAKLRDYIQYRKYSKISREQFKSFDILRKEEGNGKTDNGRPLKEAREGDWGKVYFHVASLERASVNDVAMTDIDFSHIDMTGASFRDSDLSGAEMYYTQALDTMFYRTNLIDLDAYCANYYGANFSEATLINANIIDCNLNGANFKKAILLKARIVKTMDATQAEVTEILKKEEVVKPKYDSEAERKTAQDTVERKKQEDVIYLRRLLRNKTLNRNDNGKARGLNQLIERANAISNCGELGNENEFSAFDSDFSDAIANEIKIMNMKIMRSKFIKANMAQALLYNNLFVYGTFALTDLSNAILCGNSFHQANCNKVNLQRAILYANEFSNADLSEANFNACIIEKCTFDQSNLKATNFSRSTLKNCAFLKCNMAGVNIADTLFENVIFCDIDFSQAIGLDEANFRNCAFEDTDGNIQKDDPYTISKAPQKGSTKLQKDSDTESQNSVGYATYSNAKKST